MLNRTLVLVLVGLSATLNIIHGCAGTPGMQAPTLGEVVGRIDVRRVIDCAQRPTAADKARCLGAEAMTAGLQLALDRAAELGQAAIAAVGGAGAELDEDSLAAELDEALATLAVEVAAAK